MLEQYLRRQDSLSPRFNKHSLRGRQGFSRYIPNLLNMAPWMYHYSALQEIKNELGLRTVLAPKFSQQSH